MKRPVVIGLVVAVIVAGGAAAYFVAKDDANNSSISTPASSQTEAQTSATTDFNPVSTEGVEFKATISSEGVGTATIEHDDQNNTRYVATTNGQQAEIIYTSDAYYMCTSGTCLKYPTSQSNNSGFNPQDYQYDAAKLTQYKTTSAYKGQQNCASGTCDVWSVSPGNTTSTLYLDSSTKRITQVETTVNGKTSKIVYEYTDVTINIPTNATTLPTGQ